MKMVKQFPLVLVMSLLFVVPAGAQLNTGIVVSPAPVVTYQSKFPITIEGGQYDLLTMIIDFPKGAGVPEHYHGGNVLATVLSGEMTLIEKGGERVVKTGESWIEDPGALHSVINKGEAARVAVSMLLPRGAEVQTLVK